MEYVVKTEYDANGCRQCIFNVTEVLGRGGVPQLRLAFTRRARNVDFQVVALSAFEV